MKVCHLTSVHKPYDIRIFIKMLRSLSRKYEVSIICADKPGEYLWGNIRIIDVGNGGNRLKRILSTAKKVFQKAVEVDADVYHFHDPEILPFALKLKRRGKIVVYDIHEDLPKAVYSKHYLPRFLRGPIASIIKVYENYASKRLDFLITATPAIKKRFLMVNPRTEVINNFPIIGELFDEAPHGSKLNEFCYIGVLSEERGIYQLIDSMEKVNGRLNLAGNFSTDEFERNCRAKKGWSKVNYLGYLSRNEVRDILARSLAGVVTFLPEPNHIESQPNKIFEYMSAGIPVVGSDFPLWKEIINTNKCGLCADPMDIDALAKVLNTLADNPSLAAELGANGRKAVLEHYNWSLEEEKLFRIYSSFEKSLL